MADTSNRALEAFEAFMKTEAPSDYDASNGDAWYVWKACWSAALASRPAEVDEAWVLLFEALPHVSPQAVNWAMARVGPIEEAYIGTRIRKYLERVAAPSHTTNKEK